MGNQLAGVKLVDGWGSHTSAGGRRDHRGVQVLGLVIAEHILYSMVPKGGPEPFFALHKCHRRAGKPMYKLKFTTHMTLVSLFLFYSSMKE